jgi:hypothetical protein
MRRMAVGLAAALTLGFAGSAFGESDFDEIQDEEQPGSEIGIQIGGGMVSAERENGAPIFPIAPYAAPRSSLSFGALRSAHPDLPFGALCGTRPCLPRRAAGDAERPTQAARRP